MVRSYKTPRGLFDPHYVPEKLLHREQELETLGGIYHDSYEDNYGINCLVHGIAGVGRTVFSRYFLTKIVPQNFDTYTVYVESRQKDILEIVSELNDKIHSLTNQSQ